MIVTRVLVVDLVEDIGSAVAVVERFVRQGVEIVLDRRNALLSGIGAVDEATSASVFEVAVPGSVARAGVLIEVGSRSSIRSAGGDTGLPSTSVA